MKYLICCLIHAFVCGNAYAQDYHNRTVEPQKTDCHSLPSAYNEVTKAITSLEGATFRFTQQFKINRNSGLSSAKFYSCDNEIGFLVIKFDNSHSVYGQVSRQIWEGFMEADDLEQYYLQTIKTSQKIIVAE